MVGAVKNTLFGLRSRWSSLEAVSLDELTGDHEAEFLAPLRRLAPAGLGLIGLPRWFGKRFRPGPDSSATGVNLVRPSGPGEALDEVMPMQVRTGRSVIDGGPAVVIDYAPGTRAPWPWVRDELRRLDDRTLVGMTVLDVRGLRLLGGTPFLLRRR